MLVFNDDIRFLTRSFFFSPGHRSHPDRSILRCRLWPQRAQRRWRILFYFLFTAPIAEPLFEVSEHANGERRSGLVPAETFWSPPLYRALALGAPPAGARRKQAHEKTGT